MPRNYANSSTHGNSGDGSPQEKAILCEIPHHISLPDNSYANYIKISMVFVYGTPASDWSYLVDRIYFILNKQIYRMTSRSVRVDNSTGSLELEIYADIFDDRDGLLNPPAKHIFDLEKVIKNADACCIESRSDNDKSN